MPYQAKPLRSRQVFPKLWAYTLSVARIELSKISVIGATGKGHREPCAELITKSCGLSLSAHVDREAVRAIQGSREH
jgi:hypothetical protein